MGQSNCCTAKRIIISNAPSEPVIEEKCNRRKPVKRKSTNRGIKKRRTLQKQIKRRGTTKLDDLNTSEFCKNLVRECRTAKNNIRKTLDGSFEPSQSKRKKSSLFSPRTSRDPTSFMSPLVREFVVHI
ncbi:unnamed protein product [Moneuplotes crassus]|uniref:Uncharacterized protein n=1 Tax=Euplotes crassus TaxID=5936 RepID=A0AAD2D7F9_EUPCR|nr:unnamed protein product [Moneuplotes crassus]